MGDTLITRAFKVLYSDTIGDKRLIELLGAFSGGPLRPESREGSNDLIAIYSVAARIGAGITGVLDPAIRYHLADNFGQIADAVVLTGLSDIKCLSAHQIVIRFQHRHKGSRD